MRTPSLLAVALTASSQGHVDAALLGSFLRGREVEHGTCRPPLNYEELAYDDIAYADMTNRVCHINWIMAQSPEVWYYSWKDVQDIGCWTLKAFNTNDIMSSAVYQNRNDGRCTLAFSGYHGKAMGAKKAFADNIRLGKNKVKLCGYDVYEPMVRLMRVHTSLANWSQVASALGGPDSTCSSVEVTAESLGGSIAEIMAGCASQGKLAGEVQDAALPTFKISKLFTFGSVAPAVQPIKNALREDGCFDGSRLFIKGDFYGGLGNILGTKHAQMEAVELFHSKTGVSQRRFACNSKEAVGNTNRQRAPPATEVMTALGRDTDWSNHEVTTYLSDLRALRNLTAPYYKINPDRLKLKQRGQ